MRVLHINCNYMSTALHQTMINHLDKKNVDSVVFSPIHEKTHVVIIPNTNVIAPKCFNKKDRYFFHLKQKKIYDTLMRNVDVLKVDCLHAYTLFTDGYCAYKLFKRYHIPYIVAVRDTDLNTFFKKMFWLRGIGRKIIRNASKIVFLSPSYRDEVINTYVDIKERDKVKEKSIIIPNGIEDFWYENKPIIELSEKETRIIGKDIRLLYVGVINKRKNVAATLSALDILKKKGWKVQYTVIGDPVEQEEFEKLSSRQDVIHISPLPKEEIIRYYRTNDIFVMPSLTETFGLTYAEALSQGLPVIYSAGQGFDKQFGDGVVGYSVDAYSFDDLAEKIEKLLNRYSTIQSNCVKCSEKFQWDSLCEIYYQIYNSIVENKDEKNNKHS